MYKKIFVMLLKWLNENQANNNKSNSPVCNWHLKRFDENDLGIQTIRYLTQKVKLCLQQW